MSARLEVLYSGTCLLRLILKSFPNTPLSFSNYDFSLWRQDVFPDRARVSELTVLVELLSG